MGEQVEAWIVVMLCLLALVLQWRLCPERPRKWGPKLRAKMGSSALEGEMHGQKDKRMLTASLE
jgi:hypothetical protein